MNSRASKILQLAQQKQKLESVSHKTILELTVVSTVGTQQYNDEIFISHIDSQEHVNTISPQVVNYKNIADNDGR